MALLPALLAVLLVSCGGAAAAAGLQDGEAPPLHFPSGLSLEQLRQAHEATSTRPPPPSANSTASSATSTASSATSPSSNSSSTPALTSTATPGNATVVTKTSAAPATPPPAATLQPFLQPTKSAAVLVGVFVSLALLGYLGLMVWRRVLERRYGNREILVNEEQFDQERDLGNFQL